jgi:formate hydrogenlyase transcriptional activator
MDPLARLDACPDLPTLMGVLAHHFQSTSPVDHVGLFLHDPAANVMRLHLSHSNFASDTQPTAAFPVDASPSGHVFATQLSLLIPNVADDARWPHVLALLAANGLRTFGILPLTAGDRRLGALAIGHRRAGAISEEDLSAFQPIADRVAAVLGRLLPYPP